MSEQNPTVLAIEGEFNVYRAAELRQVLSETLRTAIAAGSDLQVDLGSVSEFDSAGVQLLMAAKKSAQAAGRELRLVGHSPAVLEVFETLDLAGHFGDPLLMPAVTPASAH